MRLLILALLVAVCVSADLLDLKKTLAVGSLKGLIKEKVTSKIKKTMDRIKEVFNGNMLEFRKKLSGYKDAILKKLTLSPEQRKELVERLKMFKRKTIDQVSPAGDSIEEINLRSQIAGALFQGDMVLSKEQQDQIAADVSGTRTKRQTYNDKDYPGRRWTKGVNYFFDKSASEKVKSVFKKAAREWMDNTCINFTQSDSAQDSIRVFMEDGCWSFVGRLGGVQNLSLGEGCDSIGTAAHELGHALGFFHTHSRHDRDRFITVDKENIKPDWLDQFTLETPATNNNYDLTYDYGSLMHYGATSATRNKLPTMVPKDVQYTQTLGSPFISFYDLLMLNTHYNCTDACKGKYTRCQNHGFAHPRDCSRCICPSGYGGQFCEKKPQDCGRELYATKDWTPLVDDLGNRAAGGLPREDFMKCHYWIKAPFGKTVQVKFVNFTDGIAVDGCTYAGVEIKTHEDQRRTGYRFCSKDDANTILNSTLSTVPIITYNRIYATVTKLEYRAV
ncbi:astacin [Cooperia oncophora]